MLVGRYSGPGFTRGEMHRCATLLAATASIARLAYRDALAGPATETTALLLDLADACA